ncbi:2-vinyl bacteriochlorophyllide hydratase [Roseospira marina]|uniref:2-vinyl bacteriochlorophyllide hydratase n=1 Tax=Roseospira marina TaxID=140057 RepID=A0A5M6I9R3_9PROT|nr:2-vinyl bacteriochlorophyllide hydratase [Roseospira marina]KAA5604970.1 2-vinyl bacteriochlorophyllide hydratase [Roseospira marina]MBB4315028.1 3-vinyl bacteriochlorophyllide hydratase [Roseospira marina]MBB5088028.1 3-vinyl bacteriochlorophyllide hydratase [Roseospira marina]
MFTFNIDRLIAAVDRCPWSAHAGLTVPNSESFHIDTPRTAKALYTDEERRRRDESPWTLVQGILAPVQFAVFLLSLYLVLDYLASGDGYAWATGSIVAKTIVLYIIMVTGAIWEKDVFGRYLFAPAFYWEDVFSMLVLALHTAYLVSLFLDLLNPTALMVLALSAYATYVINAGQFVLKLRAARLQQNAADAAPAHGASVAGAVK